jgi:hypothetical protein
MKAVWQTNSANGYIYYIEQRFAWFPTYGQGTLICFEVIGLLGQKKMAVPSWQVTFYPKKI